MEERVFVITDEAKQAFAEWASKYIPNFVAGAVAYAMCENPDAYTPKEQVGCLAIIAHPHVDKSKISALLREAANKYDTTPEARITFKHMGEK